MFVVEHHRIQCQSNMQRTSLASLSVAAYPALGLVKL
jgi:hypothetical protein